MEREALAQLRHGLYRFFATCLLYPEGERVALLADALERLDDRHLTHLAFYPSWTTLREAFQHLNSSKKIQQEHIRLFSLGPRGPLCSPHESFYRAPPGQRTAVIIQLDGEYAAMGLDLPPDYRGLPDHVSVEMDAMAFLCEKEAGAWKEGNLKQAGEILRGELAFLEEHLGIWFPTFADLVLRAAKEPFYKAVVESADAFIKHDQDYLSFLLREASS